MAYSIFSTGSGGSSGTTVSQLTATVRISNVWLLSNSSTEPLSWSSAITDNTGGIVFSAGEPTRLTVPGGVSQVSLTANVEWPDVGVAGERSLRIRKNGSENPGEPYTRTSNATVTIMNLASPSIDVAEGDYFELYVNQATGSGLNIQAGDTTWFSIDGLKFTV